MFQKFICYENDNQMNIKDFKVPTKEETVRYPALINDKQCVVMQMSSVDISVGHDLDVMMLCTGSLETEILPLLTSNVSTFYDVDPKSDRVFVEYCPLEVIYP